MADSVLTGSLGAFKLADVLTLLSMARKSGMLTLTSDVRTATVAFMNGSAVHASSNQEKFRLSAMLLRKRAITPEQFQKIDALMRGEGGRFGRIAVEEGLTSEEHLRDWLKMQVTEVLFDAFVWTSGSFAFSDQLELPEHAVTIAVDLPNLIMEGARRIEEWTHVQELLPESSAIFHVVATPRDDKITLTSDEWKILFLINGQRTLDDLVRDADGDALHVYRVIYGLSANQLIEPLNIPSSPPPDRTEDTLRQTAPMFHSELTLPEQSVGEATSLLPTQPPVVKPPTARLVMPNGIVELTDSEYLLGRQRENTIHIDDLGVSGYHARIYRSGESYVIEDMKSRNGTWINDLRVARATLKHGDALRLGATEMKFEVR